LAHGSCTVKVARGTARRHQCRPGKDDQDDDDEEQRDPPGLEGRLAIVGRGIGDSAICPPTTVS
jgi:hypothetical protein